jgi:tRNA pseudouridine13 synthase
MRASHEPPLARADLPPAGGALGREPEDFRVDEDLGRALSGSGEHLWVRIKKTRMTTQDAIRLVARAARVNPGDVGSAGMKDKYAITTQWLSLPIKKQPFEAWRIPRGVEVLEATRHDRKLRTGQLAGNHFQVRIHGVEADGLDKANAIVERLREEGLPNYFGAQRFGAGGLNLERALEWLASSGRGRGGRDRFHRKLYPSVIQSEVFNRYLTLRREIGLEKLLTGDVVRLAGTGSTFVVEDPERERPRFEARDIFLTGPMVGPKIKQATGVPRELELRACAEAGVDAEVMAALERHVDGTRRDLVVHPDPSVTAVAPSVLCLAFFLPAGSYATELVRQLTHEPFFRYSGPP